MTDQEIRNLLLRESDIMLEICIYQGYVPKDCKLDGQLVFLLTVKGEDPCAGCNISRDECGGRPKKEADE